MFGWPSGTRPPQKAAILEYYERLIESISLAGSVRGQAACGAQVQILGETSSVWRTCDRRPSLLLENNSRYPPRQIHKPFIECGQVTRTPILVDCTTERSASPRGSSSRRSRSLIRRRH
jgi:hypothetical protein